MGETGKKIYAGDIGTCIDVDCGENLSTAITHKLFVRNPQKEIVEWTTAIEQTTKLRHIIVAGDLANVGIYSIQPYIEFSGWKGRGDTVFLNIFAHFK